MLIDTDVLIWLARDNRLPTILGFSFALSLSKGSEKPLWLDKLTTNVFLISRFRRKSNANAKKMLLNNDIKYISIITYMEVLQGMKNKK